MGIKNTQRYLRKYLWWAAFIFVPIFFLAELFYIIPSLYTNIADPLRNFLPCPLAVFTALALALLVTHYPDEGE